MIFGPGLVNDVYEVFSKYVGIADMTLNELKQESAKKANPIQAVIKSLSDVFVAIIQQSLQQHF